MENELLSPPIRDPALCASGRVTGSLGWVDHLPRFRTHIESVLVTLPLFFWTESAASRCLLSTLGIVPTYLRSSEDKPGVLIHGGPWLARGTAAYSGTADLVHKWIW